MKPEKESRKLLSVVRAKAKMWEYNVPEEEHIKIKKDPAQLFLLAIGMLGDLASSINEGSEIPEYIEEKIGQLRFSANFFDTYVKSRLNETLTDYHVLLAASAYYLCGLPGSCTILVRSLDDQIDFSSSSLERFLLWLLRAEFSDDPAIEHEKYANTISFLVDAMRALHNTGISLQNLQSPAAALRQIAYKFGSPREVLLADVASAVVIKRYENSSWYSLPIYSSLPAEAWALELLRPNFMKELWPAQHLLGKAGAFHGRSAVVQMPTSAGKTRATELIIRSAFLSGRANIVAIIAPFRALCHDIRDDLRHCFSDDDVKIEEVSDINAPDFEIGDHEKQILVLTPEKLLYIIRRDHAFAKQLGLLVLDEGHQFDSPNRGVNYELLVASLKTMVPANVQTILISAVMSNVDPVNEWLNGEHGAVVRGMKSLPTHRSIAFVSWKNEVGQLDFVVEGDPESKDFSVPGTLRSLPLEKLKKKEKVRFFPVKKDGSSVAIYLAIKLAMNGASAVFCGSKIAANSICKIVVDAYERDLSIEPPVTHSDSAETAKLHSLYKDHLGETADSTKAAELGVLTHHAGIPHGIRLCVEHAMKRGHGRVVVCTSTLAQGVNLPLRYLFVSTLYQAGEQIKVRDFHNLMGRAGRSGMHTEGSIVFADPGIRDNRFSSRKGKRNWLEAIKLLDYENSEPCRSAILELFKEIPEENSENGKKVDVVLLTTSYLNGVDAISEFTKEWTELNININVNTATKEIGKKLDVISRIEGYILSHVEIEEDDIGKLMAGTLAYYLSDEEDRHTLISVANIIGEHLRNAVPDPNMRLRYSRMIVPLHEAELIEDWVRENRKEIDGIGSAEEAFECLAAQIYAGVRNKLFLRLPTDDYRRNAVRAWIDGATYADILLAVRESGVRMPHGRYGRDPSIIDVVEMCESGFAFDAVSRLGALTEVISDNESVSEHLRLLQQQLRYGLTNQTEIYLYEIGFSDRIIASDISNITGHTIHRRDTRRNLLTNSIRVRQYLVEKPAYFSDVFDNIIRSS